MTNDGLLRHTPHFFLFLLSFYPLMRPAVASIVAALFIVTTLFFYHQHLKLRIGKYGYRPILVNSGFFILLLLSITYSLDFSLGFKKVQAGFLLLLFPIVIIYFFPKIKAPYFEYICYGFIVSNLILTLYFFDVLIEGLTIDRFPNLINANFESKLRVLKKYPYEFTLSKAHKHLDVIYESHKVYVSLNLLVAMLLALHQILRKAVMLAKKVVLALLTLIFAIAIIYTQSITTVITLFILVFLFPFLYFQELLKKAIYLGIVLSLLLGLITTGLLDAYNNKNTKFVINMLTSVFDSDKIGKDSDKRIYIYDCSFNLIKQRPLLGHGITNVQKKLNRCYEENDYVVSEFNSLSSEINSHNYFLNMWLSSGILGISALIFLFGNNMYLSYKTGQLTYLLFLLTFFLALLTENVLSRMSGVFTFAIFNALFYLITSIDVERKSV